MSIELLQGYVLEQDGNDLHYILIYGPTTLRLMHASDLKSTYEQPDMVRPWQKRNPGDVCNY